MALSPLALFDDPDLVWESLCVEEEDRVKSAHVMERWINMASRLLEQIVNRPIRPRLITDSIDGNGRPMIYTLSSPGLALHDLIVYDPDFSNFDQMDVSQVSETGREVAWFAERGRIVLLADAPIAFFTRGIQNVEVTYTVGFNEFDMAVFQEAAIELIAQRWNDLGRNPVEKVRSDAINTIATFTREDFDELPFITRQTVDHYRRRQV